MCRYISALSQLREYHVFIMKNRNIQLSFNKWIKCSCWCAIKTKQTSLSLIGGGRLSEYIFYIPLLFWLAGKIGLQSGLGAPWLPQAPCAEANVTAGHVRGVALSLRGGWLSFVLIWTQVQEWGLLLEGREEGGLGGNLPSIITIADLLPSAVSHPLTHYFK